LAVECNHLAVVERLVTHCADKRAKDEGTSERERERERKRERRYGEGEEKRKSQQRR